MYRPIWRSFSPYMVHELKHLTMGTRYKQDIGQWIVYILSEL